MFTKAHRQGVHFIYAFLICGLDRNILQCKAWPCLLHTAKMGLLKYVFWQTQKTPGSGIKISVDFKWLSWGDRYWRGEGV